MKLGFSGETVIGTPTNLSPQEAMTATCNFLPHASVSTIGFIALLSRWCKSCRQSGGLVDEVSKSLASTLFQYLLTCLCNEASGPWSIFLHIDAHWQCRWPEQEPIPELGLRVNTSGRVDISTWIAMVASEGVLSPTRLAVAKEWLKALKGKMDSRSYDISCFELFMTLMSATKLRGCDAFLGQVVWCTALRFEAVLKNALRAGQAGDASRHALEASMLTCGQRLSNKGDVAYHVVRYVESAKRAIGCPQYLSMAADGADVKGLKIENGALALPTGEAVICPPQVGLK